MTRCKYGHEMTPENTLASTHRACRRCTRAASRAKQKLGITLAEYMAREAEYDAVFDAKPQAPYIDWSQPQHCQGPCARELRPQKSPKDGRPALAAHGRCSPCYKLYRKSLPL